MQWAEGYFTDLEYTHGYYRELNPAMLRLACIAAGIHPPSVENPVYLELGFGQGISINLHAAASDGTFWGTDFNPAQASFATTLSAASGANVMLCDDSFEEFARRDDWPTFDIIVLHGIWSWISERNRNVITDIIRRKLRPGGLTYISYNCQPGWSTQMPIRHLMARHIEFAGADIAGAAGKIDSALGYVQKVAGTGAAYFASNPSLAQYIQHINSHSRNYLAHEYFNQDWTITHFSDVAKCLQEAKLSFVGSARLLDHIDDYAMDPPARQLLGEISHPILKETVRDYIVNQKFRTDIFAKGPRKLHGIEARHAWLQEKFVLVVPTSIMVLTHGTPMGELTLDERIYTPLIEVLAADRYAPKSLAEVWESPRLSGFNIREILSSLMMLTGLGYAQPAQTVTAAQQRQCDALNLHLCQRALSSGEVTVLASPVLGGGRYVPQEHQLVILAMLAGMNTPADQALYLNEIFEANGGELLRQGKQVHMGHQAISEFTDVAEKFAKDGHPDVLAALGILPRNVADAARTGERRTDHVTTYLPA
jgi:SAM-dependent methyltransferase